MLEFLVEHPVIAIIIISVLYSLFFGRKKKEEKENQQGAQQRPKSQLGKVQDALKRAMEEAEREVNQNTRNKPLPPSVADQKPSVPVARIEPAQPDPFAFRSLMSREDAPSLEQRSGNYDQSAKDYDLTARDYDHTTRDYDHSTQDYDHTSKDYDIEAEDYDQTTQSYDTVAPARRRGDPFAYHSAVEKPAEKEYHLTGFHGFQSAHGLSDAERKRAGAEMRDEEASFVLFSRPGDLQRAFIIREILDRPRSLRRP